MIDILSILIPIWALSVAFNGIAIYCIFRHYDIKWTGSSTTFWTTVTLFPIWNTIFAVMFLSILICKEAKRSLEFIRTVFMYDTATTKTLEEKFKSLLNKD